MPIKHYTEPTPAPKDIIKRFTPRDPSAVGAIKEEHVVDGPSRDEWERLHVSVDRAVDAEAITDEREPAEEAHAITEDEHVTVE